MSACLILFDLVHSFLSVVCVEMTCFAPCLSFLWDYGDAQCSPMMYSYKRLCYVTHIFWLSLNLLNVLAFGYFVGLLVDAQPYVCCKCYALFYIHSLLHMFCVSKDYGGVRIPCCAHYIAIQILIVHVPWGVPSWLLEHLVDLIIIFSYVQLVFRILWLDTSFVEVSFNLISFAIFGSSI